jgi:hypothetical protein
LEGRKEDEGGDEEVEYEEEMREREREREMKRLILNYIWKTFYKVKIGYLFFKVKEV